jgi:SRSO17 transposase
VKALALALPAQAWTMVAWREGTNAALASRFAAVRVSLSEAQEKDGTDSGAAQWLLAEWPEGAPEPARHWLSTLPETTPLQVLADTAKLRWRIERDYEELKSELGLAHYEGRSWRGFHHHATLCIAAYGFLIRQRAAFPPSGSAIRQKPRLSSPPPKRGSPAKARTPRGKLHRDTPQNNHGGDRKIAPAMSMLPLNQHWEKPK